MSYEDCLRIAQDQLDLDEMLGGLPSRPSLAELIADTILQAYEAGTWDGRTAYIEAGGA